MEMAGKQLGRSAHGGNANFSLADCGAAPIGRLRLIRTGANSVRATSVCDENRRHQRRRGLSWDGLR